MLFLHTNIAGNLRFPCDPSLNYEGNLGSPLTPPLIAVLL